MKKLKISSFPPNKDFKNFKNIKSKRQKIIDKTTSLIKEIKKDFLIIFSVLEFDLCSKNSIIKYTINRNGKSFIESISASNITSFTINHLINI